MTQPIRFPALIATAALLAALAVPAASQAQQQTPPPQGMGLAGPYLAARAAAVNNDYREAARYFTRALQTDPGNRYLRDSALVSLVSAGQIDPALDLTDSMTDAGAETELSRLLQRARLARAGDWSGLLALLDAAPAPEAGSPPGSNLLDGMLRAWAQMGAGHASDALASFEEFSEIRGARGMVTFHLALARAHVGDFEGAAEILSDDAASNHLLGIMARAQILAQLDRRDEAITLLDGVTGLDAEPGLQALRAQLASDLPIAFDALDGPTDGIAQVFLTFATVLSQGADPDPLALIHARMAAWLAPDLGEARLMVAQILQAEGQFDLAETEYDALRQLGAVRPVAELARIDALARADRATEAEKAALTLTADHPDLPQAWIALADLMRQQDKFAAAVPAYDKALELMQNGPDQARWFPLYARGIALERSDQFDRAEADFKAAIALRPDQPGLLNYLGYSWIDRNENLEEGLALIQRAVDLAPEDGYIQDSLAWAYYRMGRYAEAVAPMEKAVLSMSTDPVVNDHLGDVYWMVGRKREAEVQWRRALSLIDGPVEDVDPDRIRDKLARGLDAVLAGEAAGDAPANPPQQPGMGGMNPGE